MDIQLGTGATQYGHHADGIWYQQAFPHDLNTRAQSLSIGIADRTFRAGIESLGRVQTYAVATPSDADYSANGGASKWPMAHWYGAGSVTGLYAARLWNIHPVVIETGLTVYKATWSETIDDWRPCETCSPRYTKVTHNGRLNLSPYFGVGLNIGTAQVMVTARQTQTRGDEWTAFYSGVTYNASIRYTFR